MGVKLSRQTRRIHRLTRDPNGPGMKRIDVLVSKYHWAMFENIRYCSNVTQREAIERALETQFVALLESGTIPPEVLADTRLTYPWEQGAGRDESVNAGRSGQDYEYEACATD